MLYLIIKAALSGMIVAAVSEIARRYPGWGGLVASLPLTSLLAMIWLYRDTHDAERVAELSMSAFWFFLPSLPLFVVLPVLIRSGVPLLGEHGDRHYRDAGALRRLVLGGAEAGHQAVKTGGRPPVRRARFDGLRGLAREAGYSVVALTIDYNQRHRVELEAARRIAGELADRHIVLPLDLRAFGGSALTSDIAVPKDGVGEGIPVTYVPARNTIFLSLALGLAEASGARDMFIGVNALDYSGYPDCRPGVRRASSRSLRTWRPRPESRASRSRSTRRCST